MVNKVPNRPKLAIVIPAYKADFLDCTLNSFCNQTNKNFRLYIGDDNSPSDLKDIIDNYTPFLDIQYKRFDVNLGNIDLVGHWERCIDLVGNEDWIWLFSDDDMVESTCVEDFFVEAQSNSGANLFHYNVTRIDSNNNVICSEVEFPRVLSSEEFCNRIISGRINSYVVEYIFKKDLFIRSGRFERFDLAWCSDHATWIKLSSEGNIITIPNSKVKWRKSDLNISSIIKNKSIFRRKMYSEIRFHRWMILFFESKDRVYPCSRYSTVMRFLQGLKTYIKFHGINEVPHWVNEISRTNGGWVCKLACFFYLFGFLLFNKVKVFTGFIGIRIFKKMLPS